MNARPQPPAKRLLRGEGHHIAYHQGAGQGPGVVFLGGFTSTMNGVKATHLEAWCQRQGRAFVRFDYFGHGESSGTFEQGTIGRWTDDAVAIIDNLTRGPQVLVGSSMGGWIMLLAALARPQRVAGLIGIASAADLTETLLWARLDPASRHQIRTQGHIHLPSEYGEARYGISWNLIAEGRKHLLLQRPIALTCPVRLLHGMGDTEVPWEISQRIAHQLAGQDVQIILVKDGDHRLSRDTDLKLLTTVLATFLAATTSS